MRRSGNSSSSASRSGGRDADLLFTENESNNMRLWNAENYYTNVKDAFHDYVIHGRSHSVNSASVGTKAAAYYGVEIAAGSSITLRMRLAPQGDQREYPFGPEFEKVFKQRIKEAMSFTRASFQKRCPKNKKTSRGKRTAGCSGRSSFITTSFATG
jgi:hypothetical protein